jgi:hypothetical protein
MAGMHPQLAAALGRLDSVADELRAVATSLPPSMQVRKPSPDRWCVNEVLEHISLVEQLFVKSLLTNIDTARAAGLAPEVDAPPMLGDQLRTVIEDRTSPRTAPERVVPTGRVEAAAALASIDAGHARLREVLEACDGLALSTVTLDHRFFGTLNVYQWVDLLAGHERRHLAQIMESRGAVQEA